MMQQESAEDLHMALKACNEISSSKTLLQFMQDLQKIPDTKVPSRPWITKIKNDTACKNFMQTVILCTEQHYSHQELEKLAQEEPTWAYQDKYMDLLSDVIKQLLKENKVQKLQTFGYQLDESSTAGPLGPD